VPRHGNFNDGDTQRLSEQQQLDVKDPRREMLAREQSACGLAREQLEPALGIAHVPDARDAQNGVQAVHKEVTQEGSLANGA